MSKKFKIVYLHGYRSSSLSGTVTLLRNFFPDWDIVAPDIPVDPREALPMLKRYCQEQAPDLILGTSMGGMYAQLMRGYKKLLVNPAFYMSEVGVLEVGETERFTPTADGEVSFTMTEEIIDAFREMEKTQFDDIRIDDRLNTYAMFGTEDDIVHTYDVFRRHYYFRCSAQAICYRGGHRLNDNVLKYVVSPLIKTILSCDFNQRRKVEWEGFTLAVDDDVRVAAIQSAPKVKTDEYCLPSFATLDGKRYYITSIDIYALSDVEADEVQIPASIIYVDEAFLGLETKCKRVLLGRGVSDVHYWAFPHENKVEVTIDSRNPFLMIEDGIIYTIDRKTLMAIAWYDKPELVVPEGVEEISQAAISCNLCIERVILPLSLKLIQANGIYELHKLRELIIPKSVEIIENQGVSFCDTLEKLYVPKGLSCKDDECFEFNQKVEIIKY